MSTKLIRRASNIWSDPSGRFDLIESPHFGDFVVIDWDNGWKQRFNSWKQAEEWIDLVGKNYPTEQETEK